jgi:glutamate/tyrosine decarboxylase-like PLP-dependent enzyme
VGGFVLPFVRKLGYPVPGFDFSVPGVTSVSADLHKYAYAAKGASVILYRTSELRRGQFFATADWSGGIYASPGLSGTRPGGAIAAAWAILNFLGEEGYLRITDTVMKTVTRLRQGIEAIPDLQVLSNPEMSVMAIASDRLNIYEVADEMAERGWHIDRQQFPPSLHLTVNYAHAAVADQFLQDLADAAARARRPGLRKARDAALLRAANAAVKALPEPLVTRLMGRAGGMLGGPNVGSGRSAPMYGMIGTLPNRGDLHELVLDLLDQMMRA